MWHPNSPVVDDQACLARDGYAPSSAVRYIRAAAHLGCFVQRRGRALADIEYPCSRFAVHLTIHNAKLGAERIASPSS